VIGPADGSCPADGPGPCEPPFTYRAVTPAHRSDSERHRYARPETPVRPAAGPARLPATLAVGPEHRAPRRVGRPPRIDRETIARAAGEIGVDRVSMRSVAERLGVSVPGLYHYVRGRDDLLGLAAEQSAARISLPADHSQHWALWLLEWAEHARRGFVASPALLEQFMHGLFRLDRMVDALDCALSLLIEQGFSARDAYDTYYLVTQFAVGAAVTEIRNQEMSDSGHPMGAEYYRILAQRDIAELSSLRSVLATGLPPSQTFPEQLQTVLAGIAVRRGESWRDVVDRISARLVREEAGETHA
jgi:AcrR family transcriptional regulator